LSLLVLRRSTGRLFWTISGLGIVAAVALGAVVVFSFSQSQFLTSRAQAMFEKKDIRLPLWQAAIEQWKLSPVIGTGSATYLYHGRFFRRPDMQRDPVYVHNDYLQLLAEYGLVGGAAMALVILAHLRNGFRNFGRLGPKRVAVSQRLFSNGLALNIGALAALAAYGVHEALDFNLHIPANVLLMALVFGLLANDGVTRDREVPPVSWPGTFWRLGFVALSLLLVVQSARLLPGEYFAERARGAVRDEQPGVAILNATRGLQVDPRNPDLHMHLGSAWLQLGDSAEHPDAAASYYQDAIKAFEQARALAPEDTFYTLELATALDTARRYDEAEWLYHEAMRLDPKSDSLRRYYQGHLEQWRRQTPAPTES
ncbi:MAG TPA: O-antigen ligase family protein, partial [Pyrinomonadaceae bacterium]|nr:O-antigen ligase family protein [Pyrinomonadaceae bacterium]